MDGKSALRSGGHTERASLLHMAAKDHDGLYAHAEFASAKEDIEPALHPICEAYLAAKGGYAGLAEVLEALAIRALARRVYEKHGVTLNKFTGSKLNELRKNLGRLDRKIVEASRAVLKAKIQSGAKPPHGNGVGKKSTWTERALIENEVSKKQRYIPVRDLTRKAGAHFRSSSPAG